MTMYSIHNAKVLGGPIYHVVSCLIISHDSLLVGRSDVEKPPGKRSGRRQGSGMPVAASGSAL